AVICWGTGRLLHGRACGLGAGLAVAMSPYPVMVSPQVLLGGPEGRPVGARQVLLDGPMATLVALTMLLVAAWMVTGRARWLHAAAAAAGLAFLAKEMAVLLVPSPLLLAAFTGRLPLRWRVDLPLASLVYLATIAPYPLSLLLGGGNRTTGSF